MKKITRLPINWPTDKLTRRADDGDLIIIAHPQREPHSSTDGATWQIHTYAERKVANG